MPKAIDITGNVYWGQLTALRRMPSGKWLFRCKCRNEKEMDAYNVKNGNTKSCGCTRYQFAGKEENQRCCIICKQLFAPKRSDTRICYNPECLDRHVKQKRAAAKAQRLRPKNCLICNQTFSPVRSNQVCCSVECNDKKQKAKKSAKLAEQRQAITRVCKYKCCSKAFTPKSRMDQVFCSKRCALLQGRRDWKLRNAEKVRADQNRRNKFRYRNDPAYRTAVRARRSAEYHALTPEQKRELSRRNRAQRNRNELRKYHREYHASRLLHDVDFKLIATLRSRTRLAIIQGKGVKANKTVELIGCTLPSIRLYIESLFQEGMSWENWGANGWHLDHVRPCSSFNLQSIEQQRVCFNWRNYQPLWEEDNMSKNDKYNFVAEAAWLQRMRDLGYAGHLFPLFG